MVTTYEVRDDIVYKKDTFDDGTWQEVALQAFLVLEIVGNNSIEIDTDLHLAIVAKDWEGNPLSRSFMVEVSVNEQVIEVEMVDGAADFVFNSGTVGSFSLSATTNSEACTSVPLGVMVHESE